MNNIPEWLNSINLVALIVLGSVGLHYLIYRVLKKILADKDSLLFKNIAAKLRYPSLYILILAALKTGTLIIGNESPAIPYLVHALNLSLIFSLAWLCMRIVAFGKDQVIGRYDINAKDNLKARKIYTQFKLIERILNFIILLVAVSIALMTFESIRRLGFSLLASAGVAGIILGLAAQKLIATILAGLQLAITQPIRIDDVVIVENEWGWIEEILLTYVVVRIWDKRRLIVPTTYFIEKPFENWTRTSADILGSVYIYTDYTVPVDEVRHELTRILKQNKNWDGKVNVLQVTNASDSSLELRALVSASDASAAWDLRVMVREKLIHFSAEKLSAKLAKNTYSFR